VEQRTGSLTFPRIDDVGPRTDTKIFNFTSPVRQAVAILTGTDFGFSQADGDHHLGRITTLLDVALDDDVVTVQGTFGVRDWSGDWDDDYEGSLQFVLLADLETGTLPSNLSITGVEHNQATQHFRSQLHLDPASAGGDNSIPLISGKDTILRVYVDTADDPSRPTIGQVSGVLEIKPPGGNWNQIAPVNGPLAPIRDSEIRRDDADATLNFVIPGAFATGRLDIRVRAFDAAVGNRPDLGYASGQHQETLRFRTVEPLRVRGVLVDYTGSPAVAAPSIDDLRSTLSFVDQTYPVGDVIITGVDVVEDDGDFTDQSGDGCGTGWDGLLDKLREMKGDSGDIYYGLLPSAVPRGWGGCGGGGVAAGPVGRGSTAAQEIAHAFGRDHAPCGNPGDPDPNYPAYGTLPMGSIGEYGIDANGNVQDPSTTEDFMSYCSPKWVSPYTYLGLLDRFPVQLEAAAKAVQGDGVERFTLRPERRSEHLFLNFRILRGGRVELLPSFHYPARLLSHQGRKTPYVVELRDCYERPLQSRRVLLDEGHKDLDSAALHILQQIPMPDGVVRVVVVCDSDGCGGQVLHAVDVTAHTPTVRVTSPTGDVGDADTIRVEWATPDDEGLWYLVRFSNDRGSSWRTVAPRTRNRYLEVAAGLLPSGSTCLFQVLATSGIRTGSGVSEPFSLPPRPRSVVLMTPTDTAEVAPGETVTLEAEAFSPDTGSAPMADIVWRSNLDGDIGRGRRVRFRSLTEGSHLISASVQDGYGGSATATRKITVRPRPKQGRKQHGTESGNHRHYRSR
jgi:hypothetical protein